MGWHAGMTYEEMKEQFGDNTSNQPKPEGLASAPTAPDDSLSSTSTSTSTSPLDLPLPSTTTACFLSSDNATTPPPPPPDHISIFHLCRKQDWDRCVDSQRPYFPRTFVKDGRFTRASLYLEDMVDVANEYYWEQPKDIELVKEGSNIDSNINTDFNSNHSADPRADPRADPCDAPSSPATAPALDPASVPPVETWKAWIVLELDPHCLYHELGIPILAAVDAQAQDAGSAAMPHATNNIVRCLQIIGGVSTHPSVLSKLVRSVYSVKRRAADGKFVGLMLSDPPVPPPPTPSSPEPDKIEVSGSESTPAPPEATPLSAQKDAPEAAKATKSKKGFFSKFKKS